MLIYSIYAAFVPLPAPPNNWTPLVAAVWLVLGIVILVVMKAAGKQDWLREGRRDRRRAARTPLHQRPL